MALLQSPRCNRRRCATSHSRWTATISMRSYRSVLTAGVALVSRPTEELGKPFVAIAATYWHAARWASTIGCRTGPLFQIRANVGLRAWLEFSRAHPPSIVSTSPVINEASFEHRKATPAAISSAHLLGRAASHLASSPVSTDRSRCAPCTRRIRHGTFIARIPCGHSQPCFCEPDQNLRGSIN